MKTSAPLNGPLRVLGPIELAAFRDYLDAGALGFRSGNLIVTV
jgi:hypothetical protein